tara:strand:- start:47636 stop:49057 length:1422 start_codon:yes stop_codon:yes gene_type:complete
MKILRIFTYIVGGLLGTTLLIIISFFLLDSIDTSYLKTDDSPNSFLIQNINIVPMTSDTVLINQMMLIEDGVITEISGEIDTTGVDVIDGHGSFLSPGLIDMHVHVWDKYELGLYLAYGVTAVRNVWGQPMHLRLKQEVSNDDLLAPTFFTSGPKLTGPNYLGDDNLQLFSPEDAREKVSSFHARGYDFIKTYYGLTPEEFDAIVDECKRLDMDIVAHPSNEVPYSNHFQPQIKSIEHAEDIVQQALSHKLDTAKLDKVVDLFVRNPNTPLCPTLVVYYNIYRLLTEERVLESDMIEYMNPLIRMVDSQEQLNRWTSTKSYDPDITKKIMNQHEFHLFVIKKLNERGARIISGTDAGIGITLPGYSMHQELDFYKMAGMSNYEVLKTATVNPSKTHHFLNDFGTIENGKYANLVLTKNNPLESITVLKNPELVFIKGRKLDRVQLEKFKEKALNRSNLVVTGLRYLENLLIEK